jgi:hypothetical protein
MSNPESSLPEAWVERIFATMRATYGAAFDRQWECPAGVDVVEHMRAMKAHWARELRGFQQNPAAIGHALEHLPEQPPNLVQFRLLCTRRPEPPQKALPAPKADPARVQQAIAQVAKVQRKDPRAWVESLRQRKAAGEPLTAAQAEMLRNAQQQPGGAE